MTVGKPVQFTGDVADKSGFISVEAVQRGFKLALRDIGKDELIIKYGIPIGRATEDIASGRCIHIHNMASLWDCRVKEYDSKTAVPKDRNYSLEE